MERSVTASAPGRICLAGEDLDWIIGPSVLAAVGLRISVTVRAAAHGSGELVLESGSPFAIRQVVPLTDIARYEGHVLDHARAAVVALARTAGLSVGALRISISSNLPPAAGLSSSAAVIVATLGALSGYYGLGLQREEICSIAYSVERHELGTGAGQMDFYSCALGSVIHLDCSTQPPQSLERFSPPAALTPVVVDTLVRHSTKDSIAAKRERLARADPDMFRYIDETLAAVTEIRNMLASGQCRPDQLGALVLSCHRALCRYLRVSTDLINDCVDACMAAGAVGAKLTGSGLGGCMFALVTEPYLEGVLRALDRFPVDVYPTVIDQDGLLIAESVSAPDAA
jgi:mevalonate kinase